MKEERVKEKETVVLGYRVTPEYRRILNQWAAAHETSVQEMVLSGLKLFFKQNGEAEGNEDVKSGEKIQSPLQKRNRLMHTMSGTRSANPDDEFLGLDIETLASLPVWEEWIRMIMLSINETALNGTSSAISTYLLHLKVLTQIKSLESGTAHDPDAPDYAAAARRCEQAVQQLRLLFAGSRNKSSS